MLISFGNRIDLDQTKTLGSDLFDALKTFSKKMTLNKIFISRFDWMQTIEGCIPV